MAFFSSKQPTHPGDSSAEEIFALRCPPPSVHLRKILANYPEGSQILKEALQNADDAKATTFAVVMDDRRHHCPSCPELERFMGPSLLIYNDGTFSTKDWESLQNMFESEKAQKLSAIGKFGMGSRSYFHVTDLLSVLSGHHYAYIDPDHLLSNTGGERIHYVKSLTNWAKDSNKVDILNAHLSAFIGFKGFQKERPFEGTIFRLPLRLGKYARTSQFAPYEYNPAKVKRILAIFQQELVECSLFLQSVSKIEIHHWPEEEDQSRLVSECETFQWDKETASFVLRRPSPLRMFLDDIGNIHELIDKLRCADSGTLPKFETDWMVEQRTYDEAQKRTSLTKHNWRVYLQIVSSLEILEIVNLAKVAPIIGVAANITENSANGLGHGISVPERFSDEYCASFSPHQESATILDSVTVAPSKAWEYKQVTGKLFNFLPISEVETGLPVHLHANFCLTDNRRDLWLSDHDTEGRTKSWSSWNKLLLFKFLPPLLVALLSSLESEDLVFRNWPNAARMQTKFNPFIASFIKAALDVPIFFLADESRVRPKSAKVLHFSRSGMTALNAVMKSATLFSPKQKVQFFSTVTSIALEKGHKVVVLPPWVQESLGVVSHTGNDTAPKENYVPMSMKSMSFLWLMYNVVLPHWNSMTPRIFPKAAFFLHWMLVLSKTLSQSPLEEIRAFRPLCSELRWVPVQRYGTIWTDPEGLPQRDQRAELCADPVDCVLARCNLEEVDVDTPSRFMLVCPKNCYDTGLRGFRVAARAIPYGEFGSPGVLRVLREWGLNSTLTWSDMTQEIVLRLCAGN